MIETLLWLYKIDLVPKKSHRNGTLDVASNGLRCSTFSAESPYPSINLALVAFSDALKCDYFAIICLRADNLYFCIR